MDFLERGGLFMWPLVVCSVVAVAIILERWIIISKTHADTNLLQDKLPPVLKVEGSEKARGFCQTSKSPVGAVLAAFCDAWSLPAPERDKMVSVAGSRILRHLEQRLRALEVIARVSPLLGLLGTVVGLVKAFMTLSAHGGRVDPSLLAGGIWQALLTTVAGLIVAIPTMLFYEFFTGRIDQIDFEMKEATTRIMAAMTTNDAGSPGSPVT